MFFILATDCLIPDNLSNIIATIVNLIKIAVPILLVIFGMLDLGKAVISQKEDEIKKGQQTFFKRLLAAALAFLVVVIAQFIIGLVAGGNDNEFWNCAAEIMGVD